MQRILGVTLLVLALAACERMPGDPLDDPEAAALLDRMRAAASGDAPLPTLAELFDVATVVGRADQHEVLARADTLHAAALDALSSSDAEQADLAVTAAREARIRAVVEVLGRPAVAALIAHGQERALSLAARAGSENDHRLVRMSEAAGDMLERARRDFLRSDSHAALDLAAHAVDLLNHVEQ